MLQKARNYAFLLLKFRLRSENEIRQRLKKKKFDADIIESTLSFLKDKRFIDDNYFAKAWIESRIKKPLGIRRLKAELSIKGINKAIIDTQLNEIKKSYSEEDIVAGIAKDRLNKLENIDPQKAKRRVYAYLLRRGFSAETVIDVLSRIK
ncbi:MAG: regulatory protein RecX [Candidatus Omnitrophota bacterium]|nr:regulatory protein RecX [Candidatus Omnitrophota bacterium]